MRKLLGGASLAILAFITSPAANAGTVIQTVNYTADQSAQLGGSLVLGPGYYRFQIDTTSPLTYLSGSVDKTVNYDFFCDFGDGAGVVACGGDDYPQMYNLMPVSPLKYVANVTIDAPYSVFGGPPPTYRTDYHDACCDFSFDFQAQNAGTATFSVSGVPEPQTWALMIIGFGAVGVAMRRQGQRQQVTIG